MLTSNTTSKANQLRRTAGAAAAIIMLMTLTAGCGIFGGEESNEEPAPETTPVSATPEKAELQLQAEPEYFSAEHYPKCNVTLELSAYSQLEYEHDTALLYLSIESEADDASAAKAQVDANAATMRALASASGIPDQDIKTTAYHAGPMYVETQDGDTPAGYYAYRGYQLAIPGPERAESIANAMTNVSGVYIEDVEYVHSDTQSLEDQAMAKAIARLQERAQKAATAAGMELGNLKSLKEEPSYSGTPEKFTRLSEFMELAAMMEIMDAELDGLDGMEFNQPPGTDYAEAAVSGTYTMRSNAPECSR